MTGDSRADKDGRQTPDAGVRDMRMESCVLQNSDLFVKARIYFCAGGIQALRILQEFGLPSRLHANELTEVLQVLIHEHTPSTRPS